MRLKSRATNPQPPNIFECRDYKAFLRQLIETYPNAGRGVRKSLAEAIRCQVAYVSHVLAGDYHFSAEQAEAATRFFGLSRDEAEFFVLLVSHNRCGTRELGEFYEKILDERTQQHQLLKVRVRIKDTLDQADQATYYSHWYYSAIHVLLTIPEFRTREAISRKIKLMPKKVQEVLDFLVLCGIVRKVGMQYLPSGTALHLGSDSPFIGRHHSNWRFCAITSLADEKPNDLHYSGVVTCSEKDLPKVRERIAQCLEECMEIVKPSKEEKLAVLCLDWFEL